jgi:hypothetical protein
MSVQTMAAVWKGSQHSGSALLMMLAIADFSDDKGQAFPSVATLAEKTRMKPRNAHYLLRELEESGELVIKIGAGSRHGTNLYRIVLKRLTGMHPVAPLHPSAQGGALECANPLHPSAPKPSMNHQEPSGGSFARPKTARTLNCPHEEIIAIYHDVLPELPRVKLLDTKGRKATLAEFWKWLMASKKSDGSRRAATGEEALAWIRAYFERARANDFVMGRTARGPGHENWRCNLDYLLSERGRVQVIERTEVAA